MLKYGGNIDSDYSVESCLSLQIDRLLVAVASQFYTNPAINLGYNLQSVDEDKKKVCTLLKEMMYMQKSNMRLYRIFLKFFYVMLSWL